MEGLLNGLSFDVRGFVSDDYDLNKVFIIIYDCSCYVDFVIVG